MSLPCRLPAVCRSAATASLRCGLALHRARCVKAAREVGEGGGGAFVGAKRRALTGVLPLDSRTEAASKKRSKGGLVIIHKVEGHHTVEQRVIDSKGVGMLRWIVQALSERRDRFRHGTLLAFPCCLSKYTANRTYFQVLDQGLKPPSPNHALCEAWLAAAKSPARHHLKNKRCIRILIDPASLNIITTIDYGGESLYASISINCHGIKSIARIQNFPLPY